MNTLQELKLYYDKPASVWEEVLPLGNGRIGAMVWGGALEERMGLNHCALWSGTGRDKNNPEALKWLDKVRELVFAGENEEAQLVMEKNMTAEHSESFLPLGDLYIEQAGGEVGGYSRELRLNDATARVRYTVDGKQCERTAFVSYPDKALIFRVTCAEKALDLRVRFESQLRTSVTAEEGALRIDGRCPEQCMPNYIPAEQPVVWGENGIHFTGYVRLLSTDGECAVEENALHVQNASEALFAFTCIENTRVTPRFEALYRAHVQDFRHIFDRVELDLGPQRGETTDRRLAALREGGEDNGLFALYFQYGRYLLISCSREGGLPANLQGIWNWHIQPPWSSNYTTNINLQMNYWPALSCGMEECMGPYLDFLERLHENGKETARVHFGCRGFCVNHNSDGWAMTNPVGRGPGMKEGRKGSGRWFYFPLGGAWLAQTAWRYYEYTGDETFLRERALPILRDAAIFASDLLVEHDGVYVTCPSTSPENAFVTKSGNPGSITYGCTMDMTIVREIFDEYEAACKALGVEEAELDEIREKREKLTPYKFAADGRLLEWAEDYEEVEIGHRHVSHLYGLYPGEEFRGKAQFEEGCRKVLERRLSHGGGHTGWSCGWIISLFAFLKDGAQAYKYLWTLLTRSTADNLWDMHPPFQIDGNFAGTAAIANMLVQERAGGVELLPALPAQFANGSVKGLCLKGNRRLDMRWEGGKVVESRIYTA